MSKPKGRPHGPVRTLLESNPNRGFTLAEIMAATGLDKDNAYSQLRYMSKGRRGAYRDDNDLWRYARPGHMPTPETKAKTLKRLRKPETDSFNGASNLALMQACCRGRLLEPVT